MHLPTLSVFALLALPAMDAVAGAPAKNPAPVSPAGGGWRFSAGFMHRSLGDFDWTTGTMSMPSLLTIGLGSNTAGIDDIGPAGSLADRTYFNGFVRQDAGTAVNGGDTWNWGYNESSQLSGTTLSFLGGNGTSASFTQDHDYTDGSWSDDLSGNAPYLSAAWIAPWRDALSFGFQGGLSFFSADAGRTHSTFTASRGRTDYAITYRDVYELGTVIPPQAPYAGSAQGPGPLLPNTPISRTPLPVVSGGETVSAFNTIRTDFDLNLSTLSFGPVLEYASGPWAVTASTGLTVNFASWDVNQHETLFVSRNGGTAAAQNTWNHHNDDTEILAGLFIEAAASRQLTPSWSLQFLGRYDWVDDFAVAAGPSTGSVDLSGWSLGLGVGFRF